MPTSVIYRSPDKASFGFSLLEILLVLVLMGLVGSLVIPRVGILYERLILRDQLESMLRQIEQLPLIAYQTGKPISLSDKEVPASAILVVEEGWSLQTFDDIRYHSNGVCTGGKLNFIHKSGLTWPYDLRPPFCRPEAINDQE